MADFNSVEEAQSAVEPIWQEAASRAFMTPTVTSRFLVTNGLDGHLVIALGGGGIYQTNQWIEEAEVATYRPVVAVKDAFALPPDVAAALAQAITQNLANRAQNGE